MNLRVYISADYAEEDGDREVVELLNRWGSDNKHIVDFVDMAEVVSGSVSKDPDCRACDLKKEFNRQLNASSVAIFVIGNKTATRVAGSFCERAVKSQSECICTPYKQNAGGAKACKAQYTRPPLPTEDIGSINAYSYLRHEFEQAKHRQKRIIILYNSLYHQPDWLPPYMKGYESIAQPFWIKDLAGNQVGNYYMIKKELGYV